MRAFYTEAAMLLPRVTERMGAKEKYLHIVGYSYGGGVGQVLARLAQAEGFNVAVTTFGAPRVGDKAWAAAKNYRHTRYAHSNDPFVRVPPWLQHDVAPTPVGGEHGRWTAHFSYFMKEAFPLDQAR